MRRAPGAIAAPRVSAMGAVAAVGAVAALGVLAVLAAAALDDRERAFTVGLPAVRIATEVQPGNGACRTGIDVPAGFSRVRLITASFRRPGPPLTVTAGAAQGTVDGGYPDNSTVEARLDKVVPEGERIRVCVSNRGDRRVALLGSPPDTPPYRLAEPGADPVFGLEFLRNEPRSMAALVPEAFERASRFRPAWVGPWMFWTLLGLVAAGLPALLAAAYRSAVTDST
jgi:hypothetical protein